MPGSVAAGPLSQLLEAAAAYMKDEPAWSFVDLGAGAGRMLLAAKLCGIRPQSCAGIEIADLTNTFDACKARMLKKSLLQPCEALSCKLHIGDAMHFRTTAALLGPAAAGAAMVSMIDEGMPLSVREHMYSSVARDPDVQVVVTVNYKSRAGHLPSLLTQAGFRLVQEMPAPLMGGKCSTAGRIFVRAQPQHKQQPRLKLALLQAQQQQPQQQQPQQQQPQQQAGPVLDALVQRRQRSSARQAAAT
jgi:hypothetical protein